MSRRYVKFIANGHSEHRTEKGRNPRYRKDRAYRLEYQKKLNKIKDKDDDENYQDTDSFDYSPE